MWKCVCARLCSINQYIHHCDAEAWLACHWPTVLDAERWLGNCSLTQDFPSLSWKACWITKLPHAYTRARAFPPSCIPWRQPIRVHIIGAAGCLTGGDVDRSAVVCWHIICRLVFVLNLWLISLIDVNTHRCTRTKASIDNMVLKGWH